jgi:hypothetical protein
VARFVFGACEVRVPGHEAGGAEAGVAGGRIAEDLREACGEGGQ